MSSRITKLKLLLITTYPINRRKLVSSVPLVFLQKIFRVSLLRTLPGNLSESKMSKLLKLASITFASGTLAASYYYYAVDRDGYHYNHSIWKRISDRTQALLDRKQDILATDPFTTAPRDIIQRPMGETMKDLWNEQIRSSVSWIYSLGK